MFFGTHLAVAGILMVLVGGGLVALVAGALVIARLLMRDTIRQEVRQALTEQRDLPGAGQG